MADAAAPDSAVLSAWRSRFCPKGILAAGDPADLELGELAGPLERNPWVGTELQQPEPVVRSAAAGEHPGPGSAGVDAEQETPDLVVAKLFR